MSGSRSLNRQPQQLSSYKLSRRETQTREVCAIHQKGDRPPAKAAIAFRPH
ncbi:hypothetical protein [Nostoc sp.]|uniref:hypothetical protein n=1 Tax=Nostoc sp. TaxID=1180 RepID=UPI002FF75C31